MPVSIPPACVRSSMPPRGRDRVGSDLGVAEFRNSVENGRHQFIAVVRDDGQPTGGIKRAAESHDHAVWCAVDQRPVPLLRGAQHPVGRGRLNLSRTNETNGPSAPSWRTSMARLGWSGAVAWRCGVRMAGRSGLECAMAFRLTRFARWHLDRAGRCGSVRAKDWSSLTARPQAARIGGPVPGLTRCVTASQLETSWHCFAGLVVLVGGDAPWGGGGHD